jgi:hypothetical protein
MPFYFYVWTDEIIDHLAEHDLTPDDFEHVLANPTEKGMSDSSGRPAVWGYTEEGRFIIAVYRELDDLTILPVTAYEVPERRGKKKKRKR